jgi:hypothetical protein
MLLVAEMGLFMLLIMPMPFPMRRKVFTYASHRLVVVSAIAQLTIGPPASFPRTR